MFPEKESLSTCQLTARVMAHFAPPAYSVLTEVRDCTGYSGKGGRADALVMSTWPSRGLELIGIEVKASRSDWLRELKQPDKAENFFRHCHCWYLVSEPDTAKIVEIPPSWGWLTAKGGKLRVTKLAPQLKPELPGWNFLASIFRNLGESKQGMIAESEFKQAVHKAVNEAIAPIHESHRRQMEKVENERLALKQCVNAFEQKAGIGLHFWNTTTAENWAKLGAEFRAFKDEGGRDSFQNQLMALEKTAHRIHESIKLLLTT